MASVARARRSFLAEARHFVALALPISATHLAFVAGSFIDTLVLGRVSVMELAGGSIGVAVAWTCLTPALGLATALEVHAGRAAAKGDREGAWGALVATARAVLLSWLPAIVVSAAVLFGLLWIGLEPEMLLVAAKYVAGEAPGLALLLLFFSARTFLQANGRAGTPLRVILVANAAYVLACNLLARGDAALRSIGLPGVGLPPLGALGAGLASSLVALFSLIMIAAPTLKLRPKSVAPFSLRTILATGWPVGFQLLGESLALLAIRMLAARFGPAQTCAVQVLSEVTNLVYVCSLGVGGAAALSVARARATGEATRRPGVIALATTVPFVLAGGLAVVLFPREIFLLVTHDADSLDAGERLRWASAALLVLDGLVVVLTGALRGLADTGFPFVVGIIADWAIGVPLGVTLGLGFGLEARGLFLGLGAATALKIVACGARFVRLTRAGPAAATRLWVERRNLVRVRRWWT